jgi:hypothetical protein
VLRCALCEAVLAATLAALDAGGEGGGDAADHEAIGPYAAAPYNAACCAAAPLLAGDTIKCASLLPCTPPAAPPPLAEPMAVAPSWNVEAFGVGMRLNAASLRSPAAHTQCINAISEKRALCSGRTSTML